MSKPSLLTNPEIYDAVVRVGTALKREHDVIRDCGMSPWQLSHPDDRQKMELFDAGRYLSLVHDRLADVIEDYTPVSRDGLEHLAFREMLNATRQALPEHPRMTKERRELTKASTAQEQRILESIRSAGQLLTAQWADSVGDDYMFQTGNGQVHFGTVTEPNEDGLFEPSYDFNPTSMNYANWIVACGLSFTALTLRLRLNNPAIQDTAVVTSQLRSTSYDDQPDPMITAASPFLCKERPPYRRYGDLARAMAIGSEAIRSTLLTTTEYKVDFIEGCFHLDPASVGPYLRLVSQRCTMNEMTKLIDKINVRFKREAELRDSWISELFLQTNNN